MAMVPVKPEAERTVRGIPDMENLQKVMQENAEKSAKVALVMKSNAITVSQQTQSFKKRHSGLHLPTSPLLATDAYCLHLKTNKLESNLLTCGVGVDAVETVVSLDVLVLVEVSAF
jgi:hypothetical protein